MSNLLELGLTMAETRVHLSSVKLPVYVRSWFGVTKQLTGFPGMSQLVCAYISTYVEAN